MAYLQSYIKAKDKTDIAGQNYYFLLETFFQNHFVCGEKYVEYVKFSCQDTCDFCVSNYWVSEKCSRIPEPYPDYKSNAFKYLHIKDTPDKKREVDDYNPRVQLTKCFESGVVNVEEFSKQYIVDESIVRKALKNLHNQRIKHKARLRQNKICQEKERLREYKDYDWNKLVQTGTLKKHTNATLNKFFVHHGLTSGLKLNKQQKIETITLNILKYPKQFDHPAYSQAEIEDVVVMEVLKDEPDNVGDVTLENDKEDEEDDVITVTRAYEDQERSAENLDHVEHSEEKDSERDDDEELLDAYDEGISDLLVTTRSGRTCWSWRSSIYKQ